jgi:hypothetical protein
VIFHETSRKEGRPINYCTGDGPQLDPLMIN